MPRLSPVALKTVALIAAVVLGAGWYLLRDRVSDVGTSNAGARTGGAGEVRVSSPRVGRAVVHVTGAVRRPGLVRLRSSARVADVIRKAGGATGQADLTGLNLAAKIEDGRQVIVPRRAASGGGARLGSAAGLAIAGGAPETPVNLNTATLEDLEQLDGIGPGLGQRILEYRLEQGGFGSVDELGEVSGIGAKRLEALREQVRL